MKKRTDKALSAKTHGTPNRAITRPAAAGRTSHVDADHVQPCRRPQLRPRHELGDGGLPGGELDSRADGKREGEGEKEAGGIFPANVSTASKMATTKK